MILCTCYNYTRTTFVLDGDFPAFITGAAAGTGFDDASVPAGAAATGLGGLGKFVLGTGHP